VTVPATHGGTGRFVVIQGTGFFVPDDERYLRALGLPTSDPATFRASHPGSHPGAGSGPSHTTLVERLLELGEQRSLDTIVLDVGGYIGMFGIPIAQLLRATRRTDTRVHIFEPTRQCEYIRRSIEINGLEDYVTAHRAAVSEQPGTVGYYARTGEFISGRIFAFPGATKIEDVEAVTIDEFLAEREKPGLLIAKIDTEGHEAHVLTGARRTLDTWQAVLFLELWPWQRDQPVDDLTYSEFLRRRFHLFDIGSSTHPRGPSRVEPRRIEEFFEQLPARVNGTTDVLCVSRTLASCDEIEAWFRPRRDR
jgi:FkbM family methyltransferase